MKTLWTLFDGHKTTIGAVVLVVSAVLSQVVIGIWEVQSIPLDKTILTLDWIGMAVGGTGILHKVVKAGQGEIK